MAYRARSSGPLIESLAHMFDGRSRKDLRRLIHDERIRVNGKLVSDPRASVAAGDEIECAHFGRPIPIHPQVNLVYEDDDILVVEKGTRILTSGGVKGGSATVVNVLERYLKAKGQSRGVHPCHRLDRDVSGLLLFAKSAGLAETVRSAFRNYLISRMYHALVEGVPRKSAGTIESYLKDDDDKVVRRASGAEEGKLAVTHYRVKERGERYSVLEVQLETGRKNQIRVHLAQIGHPIAGDRKYGAATDPAHRIALHAMRLTLKHPVTGEAMVLASPPPDEIARANVRPRGRRR